MPRVLHRILSAAVVFTAALSFAQTTPSSQEVTAEECVAFGKQLAEDIGRNDREVLATRVDVDVLTARVMKGFALSAEEQSGLYRGLKTAMRESLQIVDEHDCTADYIRTLAVDGEKCVLIRLRTKTGGFTYLTFTPIRSADGQIRYMDRYDYLSAVQLSKALHEMLFVLWGNKLNDSTDTKYKTSEMWSMYQQIKLMNEVRYFLQQKNYAVAAKLLTRFPDNLYFDKAVFKLRLQALQLNPDDDALTKLIDDWQEHYPNDPSLNMILIGVNANHKDYAEAAKTVDALAKSLGGTDGYLSLMKAQYLNLDHSRAEAKQAAREGIEAEPMMTDNYRLLMTICAESLDYDELVNVLTLFEKNFPSLDLDKTIQKQPEYDHFRDSDEYQAWIKKRAKTRRSDDLD